MKGVCKKARSFCLYEANSINARPVFQIFITTLMKWPPPDDPPLASACIVYLIRLLRLCFALL